MKPAEVTMEVATKLLSLPRLIGADPADGVNITAQSGRYGPYISKEKDSRTLGSHDEIFTFTLDQALALLAEPRKFGRRGPAKPPLREFGNDPISARPVVAKDGKFGTYITDGSGVANVAVPVPNDLSFDGVPIYWQSAQKAGIGPVYGHFTISNGLVTRFGCR